MTRCPLCSSDTGLRRLGGPGGRFFQCCSACLLIFVEERFLPTREEEERRYRLHTNGLECPGYAGFLNQAVEQSLQWLKPGMHGLDYGCGPAPVLSALLAERGFPCAYYDPLFFPELPQGPFDFIFATECFEHFFLPDKELRRIKTLLAPGGILTVMTERWTSFEEFASWPYARDRTHVCFYHARTMECICGRYGFSLSPSDHERVSVFQSL
jgi:SAM-dependent methyltransferase